MTATRYLFTSESVSEGHPDKICDRISDAVLDTYLAADPDAHVAVETLATTNRVILAGEVRGPNSITPAMLEQVVRDCVRDIGYEQDGFHWRDLTVEILLHAQSPDIARGVDADDAQGKEEGAGDQGIMFGYACRETEALMPAPIYYAHRLLHALSDARRSGRIEGLGPDAKTQLSLVYEKGQPIGVDSIVLSTQHAPALGQEAVRALVLPCIQATLPEGWITPETRMLVNPTGRFVIGGPDGDAGLTGRKIIVDTYGGAAPHGGGAFSGKDPSKVDRSAAYAARYLAKNIVASGLAERCTLQLAYAIGVSRPLALYVNTHGTGKVIDDDLAAHLPELMDLTPRGLRDHLGLARPLYARTAAYGHFGRPPEPDGGFSWERTDLVPALLSRFAD